MPDAGGSGETTLAGVNVVAALADTGKHAGRRLSRDRLVRALSGCKLTAPTLSKLLDACICVLINMFNTLSLKRALFETAYSV